MDPEVITQVKGPGINVWVRDPFQDIMVRGTGGLKTGSVVRQVGFVKDRRQSGVPGVLDRVVLKICPTTHFRKGSVSVTRF